MSVKADLKREEIRDALPVTKRFLAGEKIDWDMAAKIFAPEKESWLKKAKKGLDKSPLTKDILLILAAGGLLGLGFLMPGLGKVVAKEIIWQERAHFRQRLERLRKRKLVKVSYDETGEPVVEITEEGVRRALKYKFEAMEIKKPGKWDGKWRVVIFDVPEYKRGWRDALREKLIALGFRALNKSVFIHAYPCFEEVEFIRQVYSVGGEVTYLEATRVESEDWLKSVFFPSQ